MITTPALESHAHAGRVTLHDAGIPADDMDDVGAIRAMRMLTARRPIAWGLTRGWRSLGWSDAGEHETEVRARLNGYCRVWSRRRPASLVKFSADGRNGLVTADVEVIVSCDDLVRMLSAFNPRIGARFVLRISGRRSERRRTRWDVEFRRLAKAFRCRAYDVEIDDVF